MKKTFFLLFLAILKIGFSQVDEYKLLLEKDIDCIVDRMIATDDNKVIASLRLTDFENLYKRGQLIKIDSAGMVTDSLVFPHPYDTDTTYYVICDIQKTPTPNLYWSLGYKGYHDTTFIWMFQFDNDLNITKNWCIDTLNSRPGRIYFRFWNDHCFVTVNHPVYDSGYAYFYRMNLQGEVELKKDVLLHQSMGIPPSSPRVMRFIPNTDDFLMDRAGFNNDSYLDVMSNDFDFVRTFMPWSSLTYNPTFRLGYFDLEFINDTEFVRSGSIRLRPNRDEYIYCVKKNDITDTWQDSSLELIAFGKETFSDHKFNRCMTGVMKSLAMQHDFFYVGYTANWSDYFFETYDNSIVVYAFNHNLDSLWKVQIGNDAHYYDMYNIQPTPDGGFVISGTRYDWRNGGLKRAGFIQKFAKPDFVGISEQKPSQTLVSVFPNPGNETLHIQTEWERFTFQLFTAEGRLLLEQRNQKEVNAENLTSGFYVYRIVSENGQTASGKWVKL